MFHELMFDYLFFVLVSVLLVNGFQLLSFLFLLPSLSVVNCSLFFTLLFYFILFSNYSPLRQLSSLSPCHTSRVSFSSIYIIMFRPSFTSSFLRYPSIYHDLHRALSHGSPSNLPFPTPSAPAPAISHAGIRGRERVQGRHHTIHWRVTRTSMEEGRARCSDTTTCPFLCCTKT